MKPTAPPRHDELNRETSGDPQSDGSHDERGLNRPGKLLSFYLLSRVDRLHPLHSQGVLKRLSVLV
jgi:hypothetical protein